MDTWAVIMLVAGWLFAGGAATIGWTRSGAWMEMKTQEFLPDFARTIRIADRLQPALLLITIVSTAAVVLTTQSTTRAISAAGGAGFVATLIASVVVLVPLQRRIISTSPDRSDDIAAMRRAWIRGHRGRSILSVASLVLVAVASIV